MRLPEETDMKMERKIFDLSTANRLTDAELTERLFSGQYRYIGNLSQWAKENSERYSACRKLRQDDGLLSKTVRQQNVERFGPKEPHFTADQLRCRALHSREECHHFFGGEQESKNDRPDEVRKADPQRYFDLRTAWESYRNPDMIAARDTSSTQLVHEKLRQKFDLPEGYRVTGDEFLAMANLAAQIDEEKKAA